MGLLMTGCVLGGLLLGLTSTMRADPLVVKTKQGKVQGKTMNNGKVLAWLGLPYAAPPTGDLRWKAPQPPAKWSGAARCHEIRRALRAEPRLRRHGFPG